MTTKNKTAAPVPPEPKAELAIEQATEPATEPSAAATLSPRALVGLIALVPVLYDTTPVAVGEVFAVRHADLAQLLQAGAVELAEPTPDALEPTP